MCFPETPGHLEEAQRKRRTVGRVEVSQMFRDEKEGQVVGLLRGFGFEGEGEGRRRAVRRRVVRSQLGFAKAVVETRLDDEFLTIRVRREGEIVQGELPRLCREDRGISVF